MAKDKNNGKNKNGNGKNGKDEKIKSPLFTSWTKRWMKAILMFLVALITILSFPFLLHSYIVSKNGKGDILQIVAKKIDE